MNSNIRSHISIYFLMVITCSSCATIFNKMKSHECKEQKRTVTYNYTNSDTSTVYNALPWGKVTISGKWEMGKFNKASKQQFLYSADTATLIVTIAGTRSSSFGGKDDTGFTFITKYYDLESKFNAGYNEQTLTQLVSDKQTGYILWKVREDGIDQYNLCGVLPAKCEPAFVTLKLKKRKITEAKATELLKAVYLNTRNN